MAQQYPVFPFSRSEAFLDRGLDDLQEWTGNETFTWKSVEVACTPSTLSRGTTIIIGGFEAEIRLTLIVKRSHFLTADSTLVTVDSELFTADQDMPHPVAGRKLVFRGKSYRILKASEAPGRGHYTLDLGDPNV